MTTDVLKGALGKALTAVVWLTIAGVMVAALPWAAASAIGRSFRKDKL